LDLGRWIQNALFTRCPIFAKARDRFFRQLLIKDLIS
jgi:hypothetical protein